MSVIKADKLTKFYGSHRGIVDVDLAVEEGEIYGFLGPNGAGKTTMIRLLLDLIRPTSGHARVFGIETTSRSPRARTFLAQCGREAVEVGSHDR